MLDLIKVTNDASIILENLQTIIDYLFKVAIITLVTIIIIIYPLTVRVVAAPQMISKPVSSISPCSPLPSAFKVTSHT